MSEYGFFAVDRGVWDHPMFRNQFFSERDAWLWLISEAAFKQCRTRVAGAVIDLDRGELAHSIRFMAKRWRWSCGSVQRFLQRLSAQKMITAKMDTAVTHLTICNYEAYQRALAKTDTPPIHQRYRVEQSAEEEAAADARAGPIEKSPIEEGIALATEVMAILGIDVVSTPPGWCGAAAWLQAGLASGWSPEVVRIAARKVAARLARNKQSPPFSFRYLGKPIVDEVALAAIPIPTAEVQSLHVRTPQDAHDRAQRQLPLVQSLDGGQQRHAGGYASFAAKRARDSAAG